jgi:glutathione S-transferase
MQLIGMLDSPYVRRVAVSLQLLGLRFEHQPTSVFSTFTEFQKINPVVKAPTLVCDNGVVLMESCLILDYAEAVAGKSLMPADLAQRQRALRATGLALAACEKSVQIVYEHKLRPEEKMHAPWLERVTGQLRAAYDALEAELAAHRYVASSRELDQAGISIAVAWNFTQRMMPEIVPAGAYPLLSGFSRQAEAVPEFAAAPFGDSTYRAGATA